MSNQPPARFEIGLAMAGAISAGAYSSGVIDFLFQALDAWERKRGDPSVPDHRVVIKVIAGASAGSITGALAAAALAGGLRPNGYDADRDDPPPTNYNPDIDQPYRYVLPALYTAWVARPDMALKNGKDLLDTGDLKKGCQIVSLLNSTVLDDIGKDALRVRNGQIEKIPYVAEPLHLYMTLSNLHGVPYRISFGGTDNAEYYGMLNHGDRAHYILSGLGGEQLVSAWAEHDPGVGLDVATLPDAEAPASDGKWEKEWKDWADYLKAALASAAFPLGLAPRRLNCKTDAYYGRGWPMRVAPGVKIDPDSEFRKGSEYTYVTVDGGLINNEPFEFAHYALAHEERLKDEEKRKERSLNERDPTKADRAVIMVDPFPEDPAFTLEDSEENLRLTAILPRLFAALKDQARFKPEELAEAVDENVFSRFLIAPRQSNAGDGGDAAGDRGIATGLLGGFGGFLDRRLRAFDYQLGRLHCQRFLRDEFGLDPRNDLFKSWRDTRAGDGKTLADDERFFYFYKKDPEKKRLRVIPLLGDADKEVKLPPWPRLTTERLGVVEHRINQRVRALVPRLIDSQTSTWLLWGVLRLGWWTFGLERVRKYVHLKIQQDLIRRDQHEQDDFKKLDKNARRVFAALSDPAFDLRTVEGLERSTALLRPTITGVLGQHKELYVARGRAPGDGYTLADRRPKWFARTLGWFSSVTGWRRIGSLKFG